MIPSLVSVASDMMQRAYTFICIKVKNIKLRSLSKKISTGIKCNEADLLAWVDGSKYVQSLMPSNLSCHLCHFFYSSQMFQIEGIKVVTEFYTRHQIHKVGSSLQWLKRISTVWNYTLICIDLQLIQWSEPLECGLQELYVRSNKLCSVRSELKLCCVPIDAQLKPINTSASFERYDNDTVHLHASIY